MSPAAGPRRVAIVGAGMVGLSTAWFLQEYGTDVVVFDRGAAGAGATWGNAGWITPSLAAPLPEPAVLRYGLRAVFDRSSPVYLPPQLDAQLLRFLAGFVRHSSHRSWRRSMTAMAPLSGAAIAAYDGLRAGGVDAPMRQPDGFVVACQRTSEQAALLEEVSQIGGSGGPVRCTPLSRPELVAAEPALSEAPVECGIRLGGQRFIDPARFAGALAAAVRGRGGEVREHTDVRRLRTTPGGTVVDGVAGELGSFDAVVVATGAWLRELARPFGVTTPVQAGRGYSFSVPAGRGAPTRPLYLPAARIAVTPLDGHVRVAGMMEFRRPERAADPRRVRVLTAAVARLLPELPVAERRDVWVGARPCTIDGLPLIGATRHPGVFVAAGHGMWGITLGPATGRLLADGIAKGELPAELAPFDPLR